MKDTQLAKQRIRDLLAAHSGGLTTPEIRAALDEFIQQPHRSGSGNQHSVYTGALFGLKVRGDIIGVPEEGAKWKTKKVMRWRLSAQREGGIESPAADEGSTAGE